MMKVLLYVLLLLPYLVCGFTLSRENAFRRGSIHRISALKAVSSNALSSLKHDRMFIPNVHLVKALLPANKKSMPNWNSWVEEHVKKGKKVFVLPWVAEKIGEALPASCELLKCTTRSPYALEYVYNSIADGCNIAEPLRTEMKDDIVNIAAACSADDGLHSQITLDNMIDKSAVYLLTNQDLVKNCLNTEEKRTKLRGVMNMIPGWLPGVISVKDDSSWAEW